MRSHHRGQFGDYVVQAFRYETEDGEAAWHTISYTQKSPLHSYWVVNGKLRAVSVHYSYNFPDDIQIAMDEEISNVHPDEKRAILVAIAQWEIDEREKPQ